MLTVISFISASEIITTDFLGNPKSDFSPNEFVYIQGQDFISNTLILTQITRPDKVMDIIFSVSDFSGDFFAVYDLEGMKGTYYVVSTDGVNTATTSFTDAAIWTTSDSCGEPQNINEYSIGDKIYINGNGFEEGAYEWSIKGKPGGASCDPNIVVASGIKNVDSSGAFCINAYNVSSDDCGEYQIKFGVKGDNYRVIPDWCETNSDCGTQSSELMCSDINFLNVTTTPYCFDRSCIFINTNVTIRTCNLTSSIYSCSNNNVVSVTITQGCSIEQGGCYNITNEPQLVNDCGESSSQLICLDNDVYNQSIERGCNNAQCFNNTRELFFMDCGVSHSEITCQENNVVNIISGSSCLRGNCFSENITSIIEFCEYGCLNGECQNQSCNDQDNDGVCDEDDDCQDTEPEEDVDENGCSNPQFCSLQDDCGIGCENADWKDNEEKLKNPHDCITVIIANEGTLKPTCAGMTCAN